MKIRKKGLEATKDMFKIIIWVFIISISVFLFYKVFNFFITFQEKKKVIELGQEIRNLVKNEGEVLRVNLDYICFSSSFSEKELSKLGIELVIDRNNLKKVGEEMEYFIKNGQAPVILVLDNDKIEKLYIDGLIFDRPVPVCFKRGTLITSVKKFGKMTIEEVRFD